MAKARDHRKSCPNTATNGYGLWTTRLLCPRTFGDRLLAKSKISNGKFRRPRGCQRLPNSRIGIDRAPRLSTEALTMSAKNLLAWTKPQKLALALSVVSCASL